MDRRLLRSANLLGVLIPLLGVLAFTGYASAENLGTRLRGRILLQVESRGEAWYVDPMNLKRYHLRDGATAYQLMRTLGLGITNENLAKIPEVSSSQAGDRALVKRMAGRILLQVESRGEAWYVSPVNGKRYYLRDGAAAYQLMRTLGLGIRNSDLDTIAAIVPQAAPAIVPLSAGKILSANSNLGQLSGELTVFLAPLTSSNGHGKGLARVPHSPSFDATWSISPPTEFEVQNGILTVATAPGASIAAQELTIATDSGTHTIYIPAVTVDGQCQAVFYVANDGSTFWQSKRKGSCSYPNGQVSELTGLEALNPTYLARASNANLSSDSGASGPGLGNALGTPACADMPCKFVGRAFQNNTGVWDLPPSYVSASYPYQVNVSSGGTYDMEISYSLGKNLTSRDGVVSDPPNTLSLLIDGRSIEIQTVRAGEPSSATYTAVLRLGTLQPGAHSIELSSQASGRFALAEFEIQPAGHFGEYRITVQPSSYYDTDSDGLDDTSESIYNTDKNNPDTDGDGYQDGAEVRSWHNPSGPDSQ